MFINCPYCQALVATDPATDLPPARCPRCAATLREASAAAPGTEPAAAHDRGDRAGVVAPVPGSQTAAPTDAAAADAGAAASPPSELSSQIHHIVAGEPDAASATTVVPIAALLKPATPPTAEAKPRSRTKAGPVSAGVAPAPAPAPKPPAVVPGDVATDAETPPAAIASAPVPPAPVEDTPGPATGAGAAAVDAPTTPPAPQGPASAAAATTPLPDAGGAAGAKPLPSFARRHAGPRLGGFHWKTATAVAALALVLLLQLLLADRARLAADARWRPLVSALCDALGCSVPPWREPDAFVVLARDVRPHPTTPGALRVTATFRNDARWTQPWPRLRLTLSDVDGRVVAARDFAAADYLGATPTQAGLHSGQSASIAMDILEPARRSVAFDFELH